MTSIISVVVYAILSGTVLVLMGMETNNRINKLACKEKEDSVLITPYKINTLAIIAGVVIIAISAFAGLAVSKNAISIIANVKLGTCYLAVLAAAIIDYKLKIIPNYISITLVCIRIAILVFEFVFSDSVIGYLISSIIGCFLCGLLLIIANKVSKGGIGGGDIKLLSSVGLMCGIYVAFSALLLSLLACIVFSAFLLISKKKTTKDHLPFGPYIYVGISAMCVFTLY